MQEFSKFPTAKEVILCQLTQSDRPFSLMQSEFTVNGQKYIGSAKVVIPEPEPEPEPELELDFLRCFEKFTAIGDSLTGGYVKTDKMSEAVYENANKDPNTQKTN